MSEPDPVRCVDDMGTLEANLNCVEGTVRVPDRFYDYDLDWQLCVLGDWIGALTRLYTELREA
jgi:hypothetical protein